jgi:hypothetical protein
MAEDRFSKARIMAALAQHANTPQALAGFFDALGPQHTLDALRSVDHHDRDVMSSGYGPLVDPARRYGWLGKDQVQQIHLLEAFHRDRLHGQRETLADALSKAVTGGLSDTFIQDLAMTASSTPQTANQLSQVLAQSDDAVLIPLKEALYHNLMTPEKALKPVGDADTRGWVRAATLLLGDNPSGQWIEPLQDSVGSAGLSQFIATAVQGTVNVTGRADGFPYGDENYQQGLEGMLSGLSQLQGEEHTELKAHVFSAASDAMGETHTREELTEGLKALFMSDPKGVAMEISNTSNDAIQSPTAFSFFFKEAIFNNPDPDNKFIEAVSLTTKELYKDATNSSLSEKENVMSSQALGLLFGGLQAAFNDAKVENAADQDAVRSMANALTGLVTLFPGISIPLSATKDAIVVPFFGDLFNRGNRAQAEKMDLIDQTFNKLLGAMIAGFNGYTEQTDRFTVGGHFEIRRNSAEFAGNNNLNKN